MLLRLLNNANKFSRKYNKTLASMIANNSDSNLKWWKSRTGYHETLPSIIGGCFIWSCSPEGYNFWYRIHCKLNNGINIHCKLSNGFKIHGEYIGTSDKEIDEALLIPF